MTPVLALVIVAVAILWASQRSLIDRIARISSPLLVIAGREDRIVPMDDSVALYQAAPHSKRLLVLPGADHNDEELAAGPEVIRAVADFATKPPIAQNDPNASRVM